MGLGGFAPFCDKVVAPPPPVANLPNQAHKRKSESYRLRSCKLKERFISIANDIKKPEYKNYKNDTTISNDTFR